MTDLVLVTLPSWDPKSPGPHPPGLAHNEHLQCYSIACPPAFTQVACSAWKATSHPPVLCPIVDTLSAFMGQPWTMSNEQRLLTICTLHPGLPRSHSPFPMPQLQGAIVTENPLTGSFGRQPAAPFVPPPGLHVTLSPCHHADLRATACTLK